MEWETENNNIDHKKLFAAVVVLVLIVLAASAAYYFVSVKNGDSTLKEESTGQKQFSEQEKAEIEKNLTGDTTVDSFSPKEKASIEKNFVNSGKTLTEEEKAQIEKISDSKF